MIIGLDMKMDKSMEQLNSVFREKMTMSIDDIAIHYMYIFYPFAYVRVNMVTA